MQFNLTKYQRKQEVVLDTVLQSLSYFEDDGNLVKLIVSYLSITPTNRLLTPMHSWVSSCCISSTDELIVVGTNGGRMYKYGTVTGYWFWFWGNHNEHTAMVRCCCFLPDDNYVLSGSEDDTLRLRDTATGHCIQTFVGHISSVESCCVSSTGVFMVSASYDDTLKMWDVSTGTCTQTFEGHTSAVLSCCISSADDIIVSASRDSTVKMWDVTTGACTMTLRGHTERVGSCFLSSTDQFIVSTSWDETLKIWDVATGNCTQTFPNFGRDNVACALSGDDQRIVAFDNRDNTLRLLNIETGKIHIKRGYLKRAFFEHVCSLCWSSDNEFLVFGICSEGIKMRNTFKRSKKKKKKKRTSKHIINKKK